MAGEDTYPIFHGEDYEALWEVARDDPQQKAAYLKLGNEMHAYDKAVWHNGRNPDVLPPERLNLIDRIGLIVNGGRQFSRDHDPLVRISALMDGIRERHEAARHLRYVQFSRTQPATPQSFSRSLDEIGPVEFSAWNEADHPRGKPENAGEFSSALDSANQAASLASGRKNKVSAASESLRSASDSALSHVMENATGPVKEAAYEVMKSGRAGMHYRHIMGNALIGAEAERRESEKLSRQQQEANGWLVARGYELENQSGSSRYYKNRDTGHRFRVSDHYVPESEERRHNASSGGFSWATSANQIILPVVDVTATLEDWFREDTQQD